MFFSRTESPIFFFNDQPFFTGPIFLPIQGSEVTIFKRARSEDQIQRTKELINYRTEYFAVRLNLQSLINFADDNFCVVWNRDLVRLIDDLERRLEMIVKWLKRSGLVVNEGKTEICLFHTNDQLKITVMLG